MDRREFLIETCGLIAAASLPNLFKNTSEIGKLDCRYFVATILRADVPNSNKRIYPSSVLENIVEKYGKDCMLGMLGNQSDNIVKFEHVSHNFSNLRIEGGYLKTDIEILKTSKGNILAEMMAENPHSISFRTAGFGSIKEEDGKFIVKDSYKLISVNALSRKEACIL